MTNHRKIINKSIEELAEEFVTSFTFMCGYRAQTVFRAVHTGNDYDSKSEAIDAEINYLKSEV